MKLSLRLKVEPLWQSKYMQAFNFSLDIHIHKQIELPQILQLFRAQCTYGAGTKQRSPEVISVLLHIIKALVKPLVIVVQRIRRELVSWVSSHFNTLECGHAREKRL